LAQPTATANSPFIVGVSGHRDLDPDALPHLRQAVTSFVGELTQQLPDTELRIIVGMAKGADLLVAQTAVGLGLRVDAVLPMPFEHYAQDFDAAALATLTALLQHPSVSRIELAVTAHVAHTAGPTGAERDTLYANLADTLIRRSSLLLALWDGRPSSLPGGTADTVLRYLGVRSDDSADADRIEFVDPPTDLEWESRLVYWIPTARGRATGPEARQPCYLMGIGDNAVQLQQAMPGRLRTQLALLNRYNQNYRQLAADGELGALDSLLATLPADLPLPERPVLEQIDAQYAKADALAVYYQRHSDRLFGLFGAMAFVMGLAYLLYEKLFESNLLIVGYLILLLTSLAVYYRLQGKQWFAKHLVCRVIAETMRAKFYLRLAGADHLVDAEAVLALSGIDEFRGFSWVGHALKNVGVLDSHAETARGDDALRARAVDQAWIETQHRYFAGRVARLERSSRRLKRLKNTLFVVIVAVIVAVVLFEEVMHRGDLSSSLSVKNLLMFGVGVLAVLLGVLELHQNKMATRELLWQYRNQLRHFSHARLQLARSTAPHRRRDVLAELGKDSLMESYLWTIHRYHREHEPPVAR
jgi:hypothetical protein